MGWQFVKNGDKARGGTLMLPDRLLTKEEFGKAMREVVAADDNKDEYHKGSQFIEADPVVHEMADALLAHQLKWLGYTEGIELYYSFYRDFFTFF